MKSRFDFVSYNSYFRKFNHLHKEKRLGEIIVYHKSVQLDYDLKIGCIADKCFQQVRLISHKNRRIVDQF